MQRSKKAVQGWTLFALLLLTPALSWPSDEPAVAVRHLEGLLHAFLVVKNDQGEIIANGELRKYLIKGGRVNSDMVFHFKDGSLLEEVTVFSQQRYFRLVSDHVVQKGPTFQRPMDVFIDGAARQVTIHSSEQGGQEKEFTEHVDSPENLANGLYLTLIQNMASNTDHMTLSMLAATPKPRMVKLQVTREGEDAFSVGEVSRKATRYVMKVDIGGIAGVVAGVTGKQPPDSQIWILGGDAPTLMRWEGPLFDGGPVWRIELVSPIGPKDNSKKEN